MLIIFLSFLFRTLYILNVNVNEKKFQGDESQYHRLAVNLLEGHGFSFEITPPFKPTAHRPPGFPSLLAIHYFFFGQSLKRAMILQVFFSTGTILIVFFIGYYLFNNTIAYISSLIAAFYPALIVYCSYLLTETVYTFFVMLFCLLLILHEKKDGNYYLISSGIILGIANLIRPIMLLYPIAFILTYFILKKDKKAIFTKVSILIFISFIIILPWIIRNYVHFNRVIPIAAKGLSGFWSGRYTVYNYDEGLHGDFRRRSDFEKMTKKLTDGLDPVEKDRYLFILGLKDIMQDPWSFIKAFWYKTYILWRDPIGMNILKKYSLFGSYMLVIMYRITLFLCMFGIIRSTFKNKLTFIPISFIVYFTLIHGLIVSIPRYHFPLLPLVIVFSVYGFLDAFEYLRKIISKHENT